jgi:hypothetical protein
MVGLAGHTYEHGPVAVVIKFAINFIGGDNKTSTDVEC